MIIKPFQAMYPHSERIPLPDAFFERARDNFRQYKQANLYQTATQAAFYLYQVENLKRTYTGLAALNPVEEYFEGRIKAHEDTLLEKEKQQITLFQEWEAILKPILLVYPANETIENCLKQHTRAQKPELEFDFGSEIHRVWSITAAADIRVLQQLFADHVPRAYIADGHHRVTGLARIFSERENQSSSLDCSQLYSIYFADTQLEIHDYNRVICSEKLLNESAFLSILKNIFEIKKNPTPRKPTQKGELALYFHGVWYTLNWIPSAAKALVTTDPTTDAELLNMLVLKNLFRIEDVRDTRNVLYIAGIKGCEGLKELVDRHTPCAGFMLYPIAFEALQQLIDLNKILPPKSTWFEPRMKSGLLVKSLERLEKV